MDISSILMIAGVAGVAFVGARVVGGVDNRVEDRRENAIKLAAWAQANSLPVLSEVFSNYAIGDYSGVVSSLKQARNILHDPVAGPASLKAFLTAQLEKQLATADGREELITFVEKRFNIVIDRNAFKSTPTVVESRPSA